MAGSRLPTEIVEEIFSHSFDSTYWLDAWTDAAKASHAARETAWEGIRRINNGEYELGDEPPTDEPGTDPVLSIKRAEAIQIQQTLDKYQAVNSTYQTCQVRKAY